MASAPELAPMPAAGPTDRAEGARRAPTQVQLRLGQLAAMPPLQVLRLLESSLSGLDESQADLRAQRDGENVTVRARPRGWPARLPRAALNPFVLILLCLAAVSVATGDLPAAAVIVTLAAISCALQVSQEHRADREAAALRAMVSRTATVVRRARAGGRSVDREVPTDQLVPGDVIRLAPGEPVPADIRLLRSEDLMVNQGLLTGESMPAFKHATLSGRWHPDDEARPGASDAYGTVRPTLFDNPRLCLLGSSVIGGSGTGLVIATGADTYFGAAYRTLPRHGETAFERGVRASHAP